MTIRLMLESRFPIDVLLLLGLAIPAGFGWQVGAWLATKLLR